MTWLLAGFALGAIVLPHLLPQSRLDPAGAVAMWLSAIALRAIVILAVVASLVFLVPATELFDLVTGWCLHAVVPFVATHLGLDGHELADRAVLVPGLFVLTSAVSAAVGLWRAARAVRRWLHRNSLGPGPEETTIVGGPEVMVAAAGIRSPRIVVSTGALLQLDDEELAAGLEHERGHVARHHRFATVLGQLMFGLARPLPGSRRALDALHFHLERDADEYAVKRTGDPVALASAICKAALSASTPRGPALAHLSGGRVVDRLRTLTAAPAERPARLRSRVPIAAALLAASVCLVIVLSLPSVAAAGEAQETGVTAASDCAR